MWICLIANFPWLCRNWYPKTGKNSLKKSSNCSGHFNYYFMQSNTLLFIYCIKYTLSYKSKLRNFITNITLTTFKCYDIQNFSKLGYSKIRVCSETSTSPWLGRRAIPPWAASSADWREHKRAEEAGFGAVPERVLSVLTESTATGQRELLQSE